MTFPRVLIECECRKKGLKTGLDKRPLFDLTHVHFCGLSSLQPQLVQCLLIKNVKCVMSIAFWFCHYSAVPVSNGLS